MKDRLKPQITQKMLYRSKIITVALGVFLLAQLAVGCKSKYPSDILNPEELKPVLFDVMVAAQLKQADTSQATRLHLKDSVTAEVKRVLQAHEIDDSLYFKSMAYYEAHPDYLKQLLDSTRSYGSWLQDSLQRRQQMQKDTAVSKDKSQKQPDPHPVALKDSTKKPENPTVKDSTVHAVENVKKIRRK